MTAFWFIAGAMIVVALAFVLPPLLGRRELTRRGLSREQLNVATYRDRLRELDETRALGALIPDAYHQARAELERAMLADVGAAAALDPRPTRASASPVAAVVVAVGVPLLALGLYFQFGANEVFAGASGAQPATRQLSVDEMVAQLEARLRRDPNDADGWVMLARSYAFLKRDEQARTAFAKAVKLAPANSIALIGLAETLTRLNRGRVSAAANALLKRALTLDPKSQPALWLAGMAAFQAGDRSRALARWRQVRAAGGLSAKALEVVDTFIARAAGGPAARVNRAPTQPANRAGSVRVRVGLDPAIAGQAAPDDVVYVFARAASGPPMPLAVVRKTVAELPLTVTLDDSMAMVAAMRLSAFREVVVGARVSKNGTPAPAPGDLQGLSNAVPISEADIVEVRINEVLR